MVVLGSTPPRPDCVVLATAAPKILPPAVLVVDPRADNPPNMGVVVAVGAPELSQECHQVSCILGKRQTKKAESI